MTKGATIRQTRSGALSFNPNALVEATELGAVIGLSDRHVRQLTRDGVLKAAGSKVNGARRYRLAASVQAYQRHKAAVIRAERNGANGEYDAARTARMRALAEVEQLNLRERKGELLKKSDVEFWVGLTIRNVRDQIRAVPSKVMHALVGLKSAVVANQLVSEALDKVLSAVADGKIDFAWMRQEERAFLISEGFSETVADQVADESVRRREEHYRQSPSATTAGTVDREEEP
jgi:phage terminase Nu1 subunit (DNA packaging protein)